MRYFSILLLMILVQGCLERYSRPPQVRLSQKLFSRFPVAVEGIYASGQLLLVWGGKTLYMKSAGVEFHTNFPSNIVDATASGGRIAVLRYGPRLDVLGNTGRRITPAGGKLLPEPIPVPLFPSAGGVLLCGRRGGVYSVQSPDWRPRRIWKAKKGIAATPVRANGGVYIVSFSRELAFFTNTVAQPAAVRILPAVPDAFTIMNKSIVMSTRGLRLLNIGLSSFRVLAARKVRSWGDRFTIEGGRPLYRTWHGDLVSVEPSTLRDYWRFPSNVRLTLPLADGYALYAGGLDGVLRVLYRPNGQLMGKIRLGSRPVLHPVLYRGHLLVACGQNIYRIRMKRHDEPIY